VYLHPKWRLFGGFYPQKWTAVTSRPPKSTLLCRRMSITYRLLKSAALSHQKIAPCYEGSGPHLIHPCVHHSPQAERHLDRFSHFAGLTAEHPYTYSGPPVPPHPNCLPPACTHDLRRSRCWSISASITFCSNSTQVHV